MLEVLANLAEILAGIAIVVAAVRAWPIFARMERLQVREEEDAQALRADAARLASALREAGAVVPGAADRPAALADALEAFLAQQHYQLHFDLHDDDEAHPGRLRIGRWIEPLCRLGEDGYRDLLDHFTRSLGGDPDDVGHRLHQFRGEHALYLDRIETSRGPAAVLHCQPMSFARLTPEDIGMAGVPGWDRIDALLRGARGLLILSGVVGSGKATAAYTMLNHIGRLPRTKLVSVDDLPEAPVPHMAEVVAPVGGGEAVAERARRALLLQPTHLTFGLLTPDSSPVAWRLYSAPCLVFGLLHARDATAALLEFDRYLPPGTRNVDEPFLIVGQALADARCAECSVEVELDDAERARCTEILTRNAVGLGERQAPETLWSGAGCPACSGSPRPGDAPLRRPVGMQEHLLVDQALLDALASGADGSRLRALAVAGGMVDLQGQLLREAMAGAITVEEVDRVSVELGYPPLRAAPAARENDGRARWRPEARGD